MASSHAPQRPVRVGGRGKEEGGRTILNKALVLAVAVALMATTAAAQTAFLTDK
jgi:hypothetical protein